MPTAVNICLIGLSTLQRTRLVRAAGTRPHFRHCAYGVASSDGGLAVGVCPGEQAEQRQLRQRVWCHLDV